MNNHAYLTLITCYHFGRANSDAYGRLLRSLRASVREVGSDGRIILVANGTEEGAESPLGVVRDLPMESQNCVVPITLQFNARNVGSLNAGIAHALKFSPDRENEWIGQVQSSVVLNPEWRAALFSGESTPDALFGRLVYEDDPSLIWADGHTLECGLTWNAAFNRPISRAPAATTSTFPCLSAAVFRKKAMEAVVKRYGNIVSERLPHYGDCTDVALRLINCGYGAFEFKQAATALKRRPKRDLTQEAVSQLVAARLYYENRRQDAEQRLKAKRPMEYVDAQRQTDAIISASYGVTDAPPPSAGVLDRGWT